MTRACEHVTPAPSSTAVRTDTHRPLRSLGIGRTAESNRADGTVTSPRGPTVRPMARMIPPRGRNCQGRILGKIIFGEREKGERERFWSTPPGETSRELRGSQRGQSVRERDCIGTGSGRGGNPRLFGRMGWGGGGVRGVASVGGRRRGGAARASGGPGAARAGERGLAGGLRCHGCGRSAVCERTAGAYFAGVLCVSGLWVAAGCRGPPIG